MKTILSLVRYFVVIAILVGISSITVAKGPKRKSESDAFKEIVLAKLRFATSGLPTESIDNALENFYLKTFGSFRMYLRALALHRDPLTTTIYISPDADRETINTLFPIGSFIRGESITMGTNGSDRKFVGLIVRANLATLIRLAQESSVEALTNTEFGRNHILEERAAALPEFKLPKTKTKKKSCDELVADTGD